MQLACTGPSKIKAAFLLIKAHNTHIAWEMDVHLKQKLCSLGALLAASLSNPVPLSLPSIGNLCFPGSSDSVSLIHILIRFN